jgi:hypothetical protein
MGEAMKEFILFLRAKGETALLLTYIYVLGRMGNLVCYRGKVLTT